MPFLAPQAHALRRPVVAELHDGSLLAVQDEAALRALETGRGFGGVFGLADAAAIAGADCAFAFFVAAVALGVVDVAEGLLQAAALAFGGAIAFRCRCGGHAVEIHGALDAGVGGADFFLRLR